MTVYRLRLSGLARTTLFLFGSITSILGRETRHRGQKPSSLRSDGLVNQWRVSIADDYQVLGPFPQEAREQHFLSPAYPLGPISSTEFNFTTPYYSHLADHGYVYWNNRTLNDQSRVEPQTESAYRSSASYSVSFSDIRWDSIRATEGWAGLQHHVLLRTTITIDSPQILASISNDRPIYLLLSALQCSHIAILDPDSPRMVPRWHTGNIYAYPDTPPIRIPLVFQRDSLVENSGSPAEPLVLIAGRSKQLDVLIGLDYEIRLFGDPLVFTNSTLPTIQANLRVALEHAPESDVEIPSKSSYHNQSIAQVLFSDDGLANSQICALLGDSDVQVVPHFVDGWAYGDIIGIEVTSCSQQPIVINHASISNSNMGEEVLGMRIDSFKAVTLAPSQTRMIPLNIKQWSPLPLINSLMITLGLAYSDPSRAKTPIQTLKTCISVVNHNTSAHLDNHERSILLTYSTVSNTPASAVVLPPNITDLIITPQTRILLALHGAGVMHTHSAWINALPRPLHTWVLVVQGLTPWGLDWREASRADVCSALRALVLRLAGSWNEADYCTPHDVTESIVLEQSQESSPIPVIAIGHSNGGQGSLYLASQFPDGIPALIPAAGYTSARLYVSTQHSRRSLFADATLQSIMRASIQGQDGDLIAGNLAMSRVHLVHGGNDENVPVWHSRERMALVKAWNTESDISLTEVPGKPHVWPAVFQDEPVSSKIAELVAFPYAAMRSTQKPFTLTVTWPSDAGSMRGWRIRELSVPSRLARIWVEGECARTTNTHGLSIDLTKANITSGWIEIDKQRVELPRLPTVWLRRSSVHQWEVADQFSSYPSGPLSRILTSSTVISIVIPSAQNAYYDSVALRLAHNLYTYLKLDCVILRDSSVLQGGRLEGSVIVIGGSNNKYGVQTRTSPLEVRSDGSILISGIVYNRPGTGALSLHENHLYMDAIDETGYERVLLAFPLRTGVPGPEWMILGEGDDMRGYAGVYAAGFWNRRGRLSEVVPL